MIRIAGLVLLLMVSGCSAHPAPLAGGKPIGHWLRALKHSDPSVRKTAVTKLGNAGTTDPQVLPALIGALNDCEEAVRLEAILALLKCGPSASAAASRLADLAKNDDCERIRTLAEKARLRLEPP